MVTAEILERHRAALTGHCYRMLGSVSEADDAVQEAWIRLSRSDTVFAWPQAGYEIASLGVRCDGSLPAA